MFAEMEAAATPQSTEYTCLHGCGFTTTDYREFQQHRREAGHELHGQRQRRWPR
jgi:hypothetical protein